MTIDIVTNEEKKQEIDNTSEDRKPVVKRNRERIVKERTAAGRTHAKKRIPLHSQRGEWIMRREGYYRRWVNDQGDRIDKFLRGGYTFVSSEEMPEALRSKEPSERGDYARKAVGNGIIAYCMEIPQEWWEEDQKAKQKENDRLSISSIGDALNTTNTRKRDFFLSELDIGIAPEKK